jgi:hypothetical protein
MVLVPPEHKWRLATNKDGNIIATSRSAGCFVPLNNLAQFTLGYEKAVRYFTIARCSSFITPQW